MQQNFDSVAVFPQDRFSHQSAALKQVLFCNIRKKDSGPHLESLPHRGRLEDKGCIRGNYIKVIYLWSARNQGMKAWISIVAPV